MVREGTIKISEKGGVMLKKGFTLFEILVVLIIIGIIAALLLFNFRPMREQALDKEAVTALKLIQSAQKVYWLEYRHYFPDSGVAVTDPAVINSALRVNLPTTATSNWTFSIPTINTGTATATREGRTWTLTVDSDTVNCAPADKCYTSQSR